MHDKHTTKTADMTAAFGSTLTVSHAALAKRRRGVSKNAY